MFLTLFIYSVYQKNESPYLAMSNTYFILLSVLRISVLRSRLESDVMITGQLRSCYYPFSYPNMDFHFFHTRSRTFTPKKF